jgi:hypothetical protein
MSAQEIGSAFPIVDVKIGVVDSGMNYEDYLAGQIVVGLLSRISPLEEIDVAGIVSDSYEIAFEMARYRNQKE